MRDLKVGNGPVVKAGDSVIVNYVGGIYSTRNKFDTSYGGDDGPPNEVVPGRGDYVEGYEEGMVGMRLGGRREVIMPPDKAYGSHGYSDQVKPGETLIFVIDVDEILYAP